MIIKTTCQVMAMSHPPKPCTFQKGHKGPHSFTRAHRSLRSAATDNMDRVDKAREDAEKSEDDKRYRK